jgi:transmembrane sensor
MDQEMDIDQIVRKYIKEEALTIEEQAALNDWLAKDNTRAELLRRIKDDPSSTEFQFSQFSDMPYTRIWEKVESRLQKEGFWLESADSPEVSSTAAVIPISRAAKTFRPHHWSRWVAAASLILVLAGAAYLALQHRNTPPAQTVAQGNQSPSLLPAGNKATLTLADGRKINLDSSGTGVLASQGNTVVAKVADNQLAYGNASSAGAAKPVSPTYNILATPRAGQFQLKLPDGTRVWLNNASTLRYPVYFTGATRQVELNGEAYFEVAKDAEHPFRVKVVNDAAAGAAGGEVEVLGTSFNVMAYSDENAERATLIDGSIKFNHAGNSVTLKPAEQSVLSTQGDLHTLRHVDIDEVTAWKNGYFHFDNADLQTTMRQLARWYDVTVVYEGEIPPQAFHGRIQRNLELTTLLKGMEGEHVHFHLDGKKLTVTP